MFFAKLHTVVGPAWSLDGAGPRARGSGAGGPQSLADEAALKSLYDFKGSSGNLICPLCANITSRTHGDLPANDHS